MKPFATHRLTIACLAIAASACGADRATAPDALFSAAVRSGVPVPLVLSVTSSTTIELRWTDNSPNETGFEVHRSHTGASGTFGLHHTTLANVRFFTEGGLTPHTEYCYKVRSVRDRGSKPTYSDFTPVMCGKTPGPPPAPTALSATARGDSIALTWSASDGATAYRIERLEPGSTVWAYLVSRSETWYTEGWYWTESQVCYRASALNTWGRSDAVTACVVPPAAPSGLTAAVGSTGEIELAWNDNSAVEDGHVIQRATGDFQFSALGTAPANAGRYVDASASEDIRYWYRVRATSNGGFSRFSEWANALKAKGAPASPTGASALAVGSTTVYVGWVDGSDNEEGFRVERSVGGGTWTAVGTTHWTILELTDDAATTAVETCYRVVAFNSGGDSPPSASDCALPPKAPTNLVATTAGTGAIDLSWSDASDLADGYWVRRIYCYYDYYSGGYYCSSYVVATLEADARSWQDTGLYPGGWQDYEVVAFRNDGAGRGFSDPSNQAGASAGP
jgi:hypothetical protein